MRSFIELIVGVTILGFAVRLILYILVISLLLAIIRAAAG